MKLLILLACMAIQCSAIDAKFAKAIHQVESSGKIGYILGDNSRALGPLQIHWAYWKDATDFDKSIGGKYEDVVKLDYATKVMASYLRRYCPKAVSSGNYEIMARCHNSGPSWAKKVYKTDGYWQKVQKALYENDKSNKKP